MCIITLQLRNGRLELRTPFCSSVRKLMLWIRNEELSLIVHWCLAIASWSWGTPQVTSCNDGLGHLLDVMSLSCVVESVGWGSFDLWFFLVLDGFRLCAQQSVISLITNHGPITSITRRSNLPMSGKIQVTWGFATAQSWRSCAFHHGSCAQPQGQFRSAGVGDCSLHVPFTSIYNTSIDSSIVSGNFTRLRSDESFCHLSLLHGLQDGTARIFELHTGKSLSILGGQLGQDWRAYKSHQKPLFDTLQVMHIQILNDDCIWLVIYHFPTHFGLWLNSRHCSGVVSVTFSEDVTRALTMTSARSIAMYDTTSGAAGPEWMDRRIQQR